MTTLTSTVHSGMSSMDGRMVELRGLTRRFGDVTALDQFDLALAPGELVALLGPSGCGKTTALRVVAGFERPDGGSVHVGGEDITHDPPSRRSMGMVFQAFSLFPNLTVADNVGFGLRVRGAPTARRKARALELLELVGLAETANRYPHQISGGQQQRVALARALAVEPGVLLLDEPLSALDAQVRGQLRDEIRRVQQRLHITTLFVTHDQGEALSVADRVGVMRRGVLEQIATPDELYHRPTTPFVAEFVGTMNHLPGRLVDHDTVEVLDLRRPIFSRPDAIATGDPVEVLVRPEAVVVTEDAAGPALVAARTFHGAMTRLSIRLPDGSEILADLPSPSATSLLPGITVALALAHSPVLVARPPTADRREPGPTDLTARSIVDCGRSAPGWLPNE